jgi:hypothetical protein
MVDDDFFKNLPDINQEFNVENEYIEKPEKIQAPKYNEETKISKSR